MTQTILVAGATGKTGQILVRDLSDMGHSVIALVRDSSDTSALPDSTILRKGDLTDLPDDVCKDADVVVLCDIVELWAHPKAEDAIVIAKGGKNSARLCTCVWDCEKAKQYLPALKDIQADPDGHKKLMQLLNNVMALPMRLLLTWICYNLVLVLTTY